MKACRRAWCAGAIALAAAVVFGCASSPAPRDHYYRIDVPAPARLQAPKLAGVLEVDRLRTEAVSHGRHILYREASRPNAIMQHAYHYWVDPPGLMLQDVLADYLQAAGVARKIVTPGIHVDSDYSLSGRIARLERITGSGARVVVEIEFTLVRDEGRGLLLHEIYREERPTSGRAVEDAVAAFDQAITAILQQLVADIPND
jgi:ABC-type uncharacterized transport system auxiliary subunit